MSRSPATAPPVASDLVTRARARSALTPVSFFSPDLDFAEVESLSPDRDWRYFGGNTHRIWIAQTYLRLREAGYPVRLVDTLPAEGVLVVEGSSRRALVRQFTAQNRALIVAVRADHRPQLYADLEVVQNDYYANGQSRFFVSHWPQPGIVPRDAGRGGEVRNVSFKGHAGCLHSDFQDRRWREFLTQQGLGWHFDGVQWHGALSRYDDCAWSDYSQTDVVIAVREDWNDRYLGKPASKLVNAWLAGVPAVVGPDYAFSAQRRSELDFIQVGSLAEAMGAVRRLRGDPALYAAMAANGLQRGRELTPERVTDDWARLLFERGQSLAEARSRERFRVFGWWSKLALHRAQRLLPAIRARRRRRVEAGK